MKLSTARALVPLRRPITSRVLALAFATLAVALLLPPTHARAAAGDLETTFAPTPDDGVQCVSVQPDGKLIIGGSFTSISGKPHARVARINTDGSVDNTFNPSVDNVVYCSAVQPDGKILIGGIFMSVNSGPRPYIARLNADGTLDTGFNPTTDGAVNNIQLLPSGQIIVSGAFTFMGGYNSFRIGRLTPSGSYDTDWGPYVDGAITATVIQPDGKIMIAGAFTQVNGEAHAGIARLNADSQVDSTFNASVSAGSVLGIAIQPDGKYLVGGSVTVLNGINTSYLARLNTTGTRDASFLAGAGARVLSIGLQTDGKLVVAGEFSTVSSNGDSAARGRMARFNADSSVDAAYNPNVGTTRAFATVNQADGKTLVGGLFSTVGGTARPYLARLANDAATSTVTVPNATSVQWLRGGAAQEVQQVYFEASTNSGTTWTYLGDAARISGGWQFTGAALPANGQVRGCARLTGGEYNGGNGLIQTAGVTFGPFTAAEIAVEQPAGTNLTSGGAVALASAVVGTTADYTFVVKNSGQQTLALTGSPVVALGGANASEFVVLAQPANNVPGSGQVTFTVRFSPAAPGAKVATLSIPNNDTTGSENPFVLNLNTNGLTANATGGWVNGGTFTVGAVGSTANTNTWPATQTPGQAVDGTVSSKYLLFKTTNAAIGISPVTAQAYNRLTLTTAADAAERDPASYQIYGSNSALPTAAGASVAISGLTLLDSGTLSLPTTRGAVTTVSFANAAPYTAYLIVFPTVRGTPTTPNSTQVAEVALSYFDNEAPTGGTLTLYPASSSYDSTISILVTMSDWSDPSGPLTYAFLIDGVLVSAQGTQAQRSITLPSAAGTHTMTGRVYDRLNNAAEVTQNFTVRTALETWRSRYFGTTDNSGNAANTADPDGDGVPNLVEYAFGLDPTLASSAALPQVQNSGGNLTYTFTTPNGVSGITYGAQSSTTLAAGSWQAVTDTGTGSQHIFSVPMVGNTKLFIRLTVSTP